MTRDCKTPVRRTEEDEQYVAEDYEGPPNHKMKQPYDDYQRAFEKGFEQALNCLIPKVDYRPPRGWWAGGEYLTICRKCGAPFIGDKLAGHCADCAYES